jgi:hypothetical protein
VNGLYCGLETFQNEKKKERSFIRTKNFGRINVASGREVII